MLKDYINKRTIIPAVIVGLIVYIIGTFFLNPIARWLVPLFLSIASKSSSLLTKYIYTNAARMDINRFDSSFYSFITGLVFYTIIFAFVISFFIDKENGKEKFLKLISSKPTRRKMRFLAIGLFLLFGFVSLIKLSDYYLNLQFQQRLRIIAPYLPERQEKELLAKWSSMETSDDFKSINTVMLDYAKKNNVKAPNSLFR